MRQLNKIPRMDKQEAYVGNKGMYPRPLILVPFVREYALYFILACFYWMHLHTFFVQYKAQVLLVT